MKSFPRIWKKKSPKMLNGLLFLESPSYTYNTKSRLFRAIFGGWSIGVAFLDYFSSHEISLKFPNHPKLLMCSQISPSKMWRECAWKHCREVDSQSHLETAKLFHVPEQREREARFTNPMALSQGIRRPQLCGALAPQARSATFRWYLLTFFVRSH